MGGSGDLGQWGRVATAVMQCGLFCRSQLYSSLLDPIRSRGRARFSLSVQFLECYSTLYVLTQSLPGVFTISELVLGLIESSHYFFHYFVSWIINTHNKPQ